MSVTKSAPSQAASPTVLQMPVNRQTRRAVTRSKSLRGAPPPPPRIASLNGQPVAQPPTERTHQFVAIADDPALRADLEVRTRILTQAQLEAQMAALRARYLREHWRAYTQSVTSGAVDIDDGTGWVLDLDAWRFQRPIPPAPAPEVAPATREVDAP